jgi:hypothetical protein
MFPCAFTFNKMHVFHIIIATYILKTMWSYVKWPSCQYQDDLKIQIRHNLYVAYRRLFYFTSCCWLKACVTHPKLQFETSFHPLYLITILIREETSHTMPWLQYSFWIIIVTRQLIGYHSPLNKLNSFVFSKKTKTETCSIYDSTNAWRDNVF